MKMLFAAVHESGSGTKQPISAAHHFGGYWRESGLNPSTLFWAAFDPERSFTMHRGIKA
jgi:hypothetical protein